MQKIIFTWSLIICLALSACQTSDHLKIGFLFTSPKTERYVKESQFFKQHAEKMGVEVILAHGEGNEAIQYQKALELFDQDIDVLTIIAVNANTAAAIVREGMQRDIKVIAYNRLIKNCDLDLFIAGDNDHLGQIMVNEITKVKSSGKAIILGGDKYDRNAVEMQASLKKELEPFVSSGKIEILYETFVEDWSGKNSAFELKQFLSYTNEVPDMIFAGYDGIADACIKTLEEFGIEKEVLITGQDAELRGVKNILRGKQQMTAFHPLKQIAEKAAELAIEMGKKGKITSEELSYTNNAQMDVPTVKIQSIAINKDNIEKVLINENKFYTREEVYN